MVLCYGSPSRLIHIPKGRNGGGYSRDVEKSESRRPGE